MRYEGKTAVVTGAAQGLGEAISRRLAAEGASVALLDLNLDAARKVAEDIDGSGKTTLALQCNVTDRDQVEECMQRVNDRFGSLDVLVSNAGVTRDNLIFKMSDEDWDLVIDTHLKGSFYCCRAAQTYMVKQQYGKIVLMSSRAALGNPGQVNYGSAKAGLQGMARVLALELGKFNINVNSVAPGFIDTAMTRQLAARRNISPEQLKETAAQANAIKRVGVPEDIAAAVAYLASDEAGYVTGQTLYVAGRPTA
ncbi:MAG TPA: 3-oxoacyl-ACP reductase FabG [Gammaproteobacteria bacterium]|nr:3-oxoacyl-ACP reductase FabG [Gammaproteobacteria bacterium]